MRSHQDIVRDHGASKLAHELATRGVKVAANTPQRWGERDRIPPEYWPAIVDMGIASQEELARGHRPRKRRADPAHDSAAA